MSNLKLKPTYVSSDNIDSVPVLNGRQIICSDNGYQFIDYNNTRILITSIITLEEDMDRTSMSSPINGKFYFVKETQVLWHYNNQWNKITDNYVHPESSVTPGTYIRVTVDKNGHVTNGNNEPIEISNGGTGATTAEDALTNLGVNTKLEEINNTISNNKSSTDSRLDAVEASIVQILSQINNITLTYNDGSYYMSADETEN